MIAYPWEVGYMIEALGLDIELVALRKAYSEQVLSVTE